ncbi:hypothetical protein AAMO2058_000725200 [Amorphochlora amoebiformis]
MRCTCYVSEFSRKPHGDGKVEASIDDYWRERVKANPSMFNATKLRYSDSEIVYGEKGSTLHLSLWLTDYKTYIGGDFTEHSQRMADDGLKDFGDPYAHKARKIGVACLMTTKDDRIILIRRSKAVAVEPGKIDCVGGHPEPSEIGWKVDTDVSEDVGLAGRVINELFDSTRKEGRDEVGVDIDCLQDPILLGANILAPPKSAVSMTFLVKCEMTSENVKKIYAQGPPEAFESTQILCLPVRQLLDLISHPSTDNALSQDSENLRISDMTISLRGSLFLLARYFRAVD